MTAWFPKIIFLVLLLVVHSQARFFLGPTIYEIDGEIVEFYKHWHAKKVEDIDDVINEEVKSTYIGDLHEKLMLSFRIVSRCSARTSKPIIRCYALLDLRDKNMVWSWRVIIARVSGVDME
ncbi:hypothetical protein HID58_040656 [Brassica napus]|uniref:Cysteine proteinase inhibitor n=1 Tax=Brassica napus TaxID=3708 RepID=A0ABQ8B8W9_BRANA|nr:hypothetical protein HID58_040656 [Brassica napus]